MIRRYALLVSEGRLPLFSAHIFHMSKTHCSRILDQTLHASSILCEPKTMSMKTGGDFTVAVKAKSTGSLHSCYSTRRGHPWGHGLNFGKDTSICPRRYHQFRNGNNDTINNFALGHCQYWVSHFFFVFFSFKISCFKTDENFTVDILQVCLDLWNSVIFDVMHLNLISILHNFL